MEENQFDNEEVEQTHVENEVDQEADQEAGQESAQEDSSTDKSLDSNIVALREANKKAIKERDEYAKRLQDIEYYRQQEMSRQQPQQNQQDESTNYSPDDLVEWKVVQKELAKRDEQFKRYQQQNEASSAESRLRNEYPDFDSVVSAENIQLFNQLEPELAETIGSSTNMYKKAVAAYKAIKKLSIADNSSDRNRIKNNALKPKPTSSTSSKSSDSPLSKANSYGNSLNDEQKNALWKEMQEVTGRR
jgi:hypothetical protein